MILATVLVPAVLDGRRNSLRQSIIAAGKVEECGVVLFYPQRPGIQLAAEDCDFGAVAHHVDAEVDRPVERDLAVAGDDAEVLAALAGVVHVRAAAADRHHRRARPVRAQDQLRELDLCPGSNTDAAAFLEFDLRPRIFSRPKLHAVGDRHVHDRPFESLSVSAVELDRAVHQAQADDADLRIRPRGRRHHQCQNQQNEKCGIQSARCHGRSSTQSHSCAPGRCSGHSPY